MQTKQERQARDRRLQTKRFRARRVVDFHQGKWQLFANTVVDRKSLFWDFRSDAKWARQFVTHKIHDKPKTNTWVFRVWPVGKEDEQVAIKLYRIRPSSDRVENKVDNHEIEIRYLKLFSELMDRRITPHITLPFGRTLLEGSQVHQLFPELKVSDKDQYQLMVTEATDTVLSHILRSSPISAYMLKALIFQCIYTLAVLQQYFPTFRHNDLHASNILVQSLDTRPTETVEYKWGVSSYTIDLAACPYRCMLWDMYFSSIDEDSVQNVQPSRPSLYTDKVKFSRTKANKYYDLHKLLDSIIYLLGRSINKELLEADFFTDAVPERLRCMSKGLSKLDKSDLQLWDRELWSADQLLRHTYFDELKRIPSHPPLVTYRLA